jgi:hypothetical protein
MLHRYQVRHKAMTAVKDKTIIYPDSDCQPMEDSFLYLLELSKELAQYGKNLSKKS